MPDDDASDERPTVNQSAAAGSKRSSGHQVNVGNGRYQLLELLGRGGMGEVMTARDEQLGRDVAIKRMLPEASGDDDLERFLREAHVQGRLDHPAIVPV